MMESIKKFGRTLLRDYFYAEPPFALDFIVKKFSPTRGHLWLGACALAAAYCVVTPALGLCSFAAAVGYTLPLLALMTGVMSGLHAYGMRTRKECAVGNMGYLAGGPFPILAFTEPQGPGRKLALLENTQNLIARKTAKYAHDTQVPSFVMEKLKPYLRDAEESAKDVMLVANIPGNVQTVPQLTFHREVFNTAGQRVRADIAAVATKRFPVEEEALLREQQEKERLARAEALETAARAVREAMLKGTTRKIKVGLPLKILT